MLSCQLFTVPANDEPISDVMLMPCDATTEIGPYAAAKLRENIRTKLHTHTDRQTGTERLRIRDT